MELLTDLRKRRASPLTTVLAIGNFDGFHRGHQAILEKASTQAKHQNAERVGVLSFNPHPSKILKQDESPKLLTTLTERREIFLEIGSGVFVEQTFDSEFARLSPDDFLTLLRNSIDLKGIVVGDDFRYGHEGKGNLESLNAWGKKHQVSISAVPPIQEGGERISSSRIREALSKGEVRAASALLGSPFFYTGVVEKGDARGSRIGFPTANLWIPPEKLTLPFGVYVSRLMTDDGEYPSVTNLGVRPTFAGNSKQPRIETHVFGQTLDLRGTNVKIEFLERVRDERRFSGVEELVAQIALDIETARAFFDKI